MNQKEKEDLRGLRIFAVWLILLVIVGGHIMFKITRDTTTATTERARVWNKN